MSDNKITGDWSVPGGKSYPGHLDVNYETGSITLEIYSNEYIDGSAVDFKNDAFGKQIKRFFYYIWGGYGFADRITLYRCGWLGTSIIGKDLFLIKYNVGFLIRGAHVTADGDFLIKSGKFSFPYLGGFYYGWDHESIPATDFDYNRIDKITQQSLKINEDLEVTFSSLITSHFLELSVSHKIQVNDYMTFNYKMDVPFSKLLTDSITFKKLLEFSFGKPLRHKIHSVQLNADQLATLPKPFFQEDKNFYVTNFTFNENKEIERGSENQNHMLISRWQIAKEDLDALIVRWYKNGRLTNIYDYYLDSNNWFQGVKEAKLSNVMFNNRFLNLIQGLEDYYREKLESTKIQADRQIFEIKKKTVLDLIKEPELKKWLNDTFKTTQYVKLEDKLAAIADECIPILQKIFKPINWATFPGSAKDFRHKLSHGMNKNTNMGQRLNLDYQKARLLLCICILKSLEIKNIERIIEDNYKIQQSVAEIFHLQAKYVE